MALFILFVIFVIAAVISTYKDWWILELISWILAGVCVAILIVSLVLLVSFNYEYNANVEICNLLQARIENYDGYNDPYLPWDVQDWNKDIVIIQNMNESIWFGFSVPDSYENFETIPFDFLYQENQN